MPQRLACARRGSDGARVCVAIHRGIYAITPRSAAARIIGQIRLLATRRKLIG
jgi:hypothetical protein